MIYKNGDKYKGDFSGDVRHGQGVLTRANGDKYKGAWSEGLFGGSLWRPRGQGVMTWANGDTYEGGWLDGKRGGYGVFTKANGDCYRGVWLDGMKDDVFVAYNKNKLIGAYKYKKDEIEIEIQ